MANNIKMHFLYNADTNRLKQLTQRNVLFYATLTTTPLLHDSLTSMPFILFDFFFFSSAAISNRENE